MFEPSAGPRIFAVPPGADFARALVDGLCQHMANEPPEAMARVELYLNTRRMQRRVQEAFCAEGALLLPQLRLVTDLAQHLPQPGQPAPVPALRRRLELAQLVAELLARAPDLAPRSATYDLADSLAALLDEMQGEGLGPEALDAIDIAEHSRHWERSLKFLRIVARYFEADAPPDAEALRRRVAKALADKWQDAPPTHPVIVAGSTGSRGTTALFMRSVARLPQGALVLPGFDFDMPRWVWSGLDDAMTAEDHPQFRFRKLMENIGFSAETVTKWGAAPAPGRARLISLSLRPAPVTDQWMEEGQALVDLPALTASLSLIEAPDPRREALAIALALRKAAEDGRTACLISPDRSLTRRVTAALDRWGILPDDSAGQPLGLSPPGRLLRHVAQLFGRKLTAEALLTLLKHPLTHSGADRGPHLLHSRSLELRLRRRGPVFPSGADLRGMAEAANVGTDWANWLGKVIDALAVAGDLPLCDHISRHRRLTELLAQGPEGEGSGALWEAEAGAAALAAVEELAQEAEFGGILSAADYADLFATILARKEVRGAVEPHPTISILGPREAREQGAELVILGGLTDGTWPALPAPDAWLSRKMRLDAALLLPERQVGLSAHDYQIAASAPEVILSRARRDAEAETIPSRWLNRLTNLLSGLAGQGGPEALAQMRTRGERWLAQARALEDPGAPVPLAPRPAPRPPLAARPRELPVTQIQKLIRDPYAVYARYTLDLKPLNPLHPGPDARLRGSVLHLILAAFRRIEPGEPLPEARARLLAITEQVLAAETPWPTARRLWRARLERVADWFLVQEAGRDGTPVLIEKNGSVTLKNEGFTLTAIPDRIDRLEDGRLHLIDYKTGTPPSEKQQKSFDKQLLLEAAMAERGGFDTLGPSEVAAITYIGLGGTPKEISTVITEGMTEEVWAGLERLIARYLSPETGFAARRAMFKEEFAGDYDHLSRYGEWDLSTPAQPEDVG